MKQTTATSVAQALHWIHTNAHHIIMTEWPRSMPERDKTMKNSSHVSLSNYHEKLRIPATMVKSVNRYIRPNKRPFDTRMFAVTRRGIQLIREALEA